jgi:hypothetical protein
LSFQDKWGNFKQVLKIPPKLKLNTGNRKKTKTESIGKLKGVDVGSQNAKSASTGWTPGFLKRLIQLFRRTYFVPSSVEQNCKPFEEAALAIIHLESVGILSFRPAKFVHLRYRSVFRDAFVGHRERSVLDLRRTRPAPKIWIDWHSNEKLLTSAALPAFIIPIILDAREETVERVCEKSKAEDILKCAKE